MDPSLINVDGTAHKTPISRSFANSKHAFAAVKSQWFANGNDAVKEKQPSRFPTFYYQATLLGHASPEISPTANKWNVYLMTFPLGNMKDNPVLDKRLTIFLVNLRRNTRN